MLLYKEVGKIFATEYRRLGARICYYRLLKGISQEELVSRVNCSKSYLSRIEHGSTGRSVCYTTILAIAAALEIDLVKLVEKDI